MAFCSKNICKDESVKSVIRQIERCKFKMQNQSRVLSWHNHSPDKRPLRRNKQQTNENKYLHPDVYPQDPKQEEDKMNSLDRLTKGYLFPSHASEYDSLIKVNLSILIKNIYLES